MSILQSRSLKSGSGFFIMEKDRDGKGWEVYEKHEDEGTPCDAGDDDCGGV